MLSNVFISYQDQFKFCKEHNKFFKDYTYFNIDNIAENLTAIYPSLKEDTKTGMLIDNNVIETPEKFFKFNIKLPYSKTAFIFSREISNTDTNEFLGQLSICCLCEEKIEGRWFWKKESIILIPCAILKDKNKLIFLDKDIVFKYELNRSFGIERTFINKNNNEDYLSSFLATIVLCSLQILNCKNVNRIRQSLSQNAQKKHEKHYKYPIVDYYVLSIPSLYYMKKGDTFESWQNRLHTCRGHFKTYDRYNPLFGKYTGTYWWSSQIRGNKQLGSIQKEYKVNWKKNE